MPDVEWVRVRDDATGHHITIPKRLVRDGVTVLDQPALNRSGEPRKPTYKVAKGSKPAPSTKTATKPNKKAAPTSPVTAADQPSINTDGPSADTDKE